MARRKHHVKRHHTRRKRSHSGKMAGIGGTLATVAFATAGAAAAFYVKKMLSKQSETIQNAVPLAAAFVLPMVSKNKIVADVALGMGVFGGVGLLQSSKVLQGLAGYSLPMIGATTNFEIQTAAPIVAGSKEACYTY